MPDWLRIAPEVREARAVVALESTIIAHGMPYPDNLATARLLEQTVRHAGAVPATIAVIEGAIRVGLSPAELETLAQSKDVLKLSRADLPYAVCSAKTGATTVAATMICSHLAGIRVFATGGIGGVHRGAESTFDISADLEELARTPVAVVCAGAKALLDLPKTLEYLETCGVPVIGYQTGEFPAFWSRQSGLKTPLRLDTPEAIARFLTTKWQMGLSGGAVICNPVPTADEIPASEIRAYIDAAIAEAASAGISGKSVTPHILSRMVALTNGRSLRTNIALAANNAQLAAQIANRGLTTLSQGA
jgi:pseudouridine-5'-phosphate glycosidase